MARSLSKDGMQQLLRSIIEIFDRLEQGNATAEELRERTRSLPMDQYQAVMLVIDLAEMLHTCPKESTAAAVTVVNPRYRKGTGRQPAAWSSCLWRPPEARQ